MRIKGGDRIQVRKWRLEQDEKGYCPHYHRVGRVKVEVRFLKNQPRQEFWRVVNIATGAVHEFRFNGTPLSRGTLGRMVGPLIKKRMIKR